MPLVSFYLSPKPPFRLDLTVWALRRLPQNRIDRWDGRTYTRAAVIGTETARIDISQPRGLRIHVSVSTAKRPVAPRSATALLEKVLGIRKDLQDFYDLASCDDRIAQLAARFRGLKPPRFPSIFEAVINAIACQQLSLNVGIELLNRLTAAFGRASTERGDDLRAFPLPEDLAVAAPADLRALGFSNNKAQAIIALAKDSAAGRTDLERIAGMDDAEALAHLRSLGGIGRWSAEYVLLRGLGRIHMFPGDDVGAQRNLQGLLHLKEKPDYDRIKTITSAWHPYAGFLYFHFLLNKLEMKSYF